MFSKADIRKVSIGLQRKLYDELIYELGKEELIHLTKQDVEEVSFDTEMEVELNKEEAKVREIITLTKSLLSALNLESDAIADLDLQVFSDLLLERYASDRCGVTTGRSLAEPFTLDQLLVPCQRVAVGVAVLSL